ncbi:MAG: PDZ domain-containing protein [Fibromonadaceae bacterium]|jgi:membrane-associated protease RseP (regulator of RpoE activity)|nr:PDZ domain-containing protein [Fibromonadaceae bacterium]
MRKVLKSLLIAAALAGAAIAGQSENFGGLGISVWTGKNGVKVAGVLPNSPAEAIGLQPGDLILSANGTEFSAVDASQQINYLRGEAGSSVTMVVERGGEKITLSANRVSISVQNLDASEISAWYGKSSGLTAEELNHLASQKVGEGYEMLGVMQHGMPIERDAENLSALAMQHVSVKKAEEVKLPEAKPPVQNEVSSNADTAVLNGQKSLTLVNAKGARIKKQNVPLYKIIK